MRKVFAIALLGLLLFNMGGYRLYVDHLETRSTRQLTDRLDAAAYRDEELIEIKVPVNLPYQNNWEAFERYNGEIVIDGVHYNYVKRKLFNDTLTLLCIPNTDKMRLYNARETFFSLVNDLQQESDRGQHPQAPKSVKLPVLECTEAGTIYGMDHPKPILVSLRAGGQDLRQVHKPEPNHRPPAPIC